MMWLRQSTASQEILLGPFLDETDGITTMEGLSIVNTDIKIWKEGGTTEANKTSGGATHIASGRYYTVLDATDTATAGKLVINVHKATSLPVRCEFMVVPAAIYDSMILGSSNGVPANMVQVNGTAQTPGDIQATLADIQGTTFNTSTDSLRAIRDNHPANFADMSIELVTGKVSLTDQTLLDIVAEIDLSSTSLDDIQSRLLTTTSTGLLEDYLDGTAYMPVDPYRIDFSVTGNTLTVKAPDDTTTAYTKTLGTDAGALPVISSI